MAELVSGAEGVPRAEAFAVLDGEWSELTERHVRLLRAHDVRIFDSWTLVSPTWRCPCCGRSKGDLFRLVSGRVLQGKLDDHHDHFVSYANHRLREVFGEALLATMPFQVQIAIADAQNLVRGFGRSLVCSDCNQADAAGKKAVRDLLGDDFQWFSFPVEDIRAFIGRPRRPNQPHVVAPDEARHVFECRAHRKTLTHRKSIVNATIEYLRREIHWKSTERTESVQEAYDSYRDLLADLGLGANAMSALKRLSASETDTDRKQWRNPPKRNLPAPPESAIDHYIVNLAPESFRSLPDDWKCPGCGRWKRKTVRYSNRNAERGGFRLHASVGKIGPADAEALVCSDCRFVAVGLAGEADCYVDAVLPTDVTDAIRPYSNKRHPLAAFEAQIDLVVRRIVERTARDMRQDGKFAVWDEDGGFGGDDFEPLP
ncbi:hypothetical protein JHL17_13345 [Azospirillum sp. YIM B02556]|uniref:Transposase n=1 Tax=Azospirillum endophyticum TaxID=2800326 RepID=A0ABS1F4T9_9PROT|nr:hypothetical protein [Azospirillum endophyticum]MBK1838399.1 hypothetical protein [Azospirillum endophyticum]